MILHCELIDNCGSLKYDVLFSNKKAKQALFYVYFDIDNTGLIQTK